MWKKPEYSKKQINEAGRIIIDPNASENDRKHALAVIDNWRAAHAYPMHTFAINLKRQTADVDGAVVVQRIKRLDTICGKLKRFPDMQLYRVQDLGGCRVILPTVEDVYKVKERLETSRIRHEPKTPKDYIQEPNPSTGYRSVHLIYKYKSDKIKEYNGLMIEIQLRTKLQHLWATAVETVGVFTGNGLKFNQGSSKWIELFKLFSALFALEEKTPLPDGVPTDKLDLLERILSLDKELNAIDKMRTIGIISKRIGHVKKKAENAYYVLELNRDVHKINIYVYPGALKGLDRATEKYYEVENSKGNQKIDVVLVAAESYEALVDAYPNYFSDISEFIKILLSVMQKTIDEARDEKLQEELTPV